MNNSMKAHQSASATCVDQALRRTLDAGDIPAHVQARLDKAYASLAAIPQDQHAKGPRKRARKAMMALGLAAACALIAGAAYAGTTMLQMHAGDGGFFSSERNLPVFDSMEPGARALSAEVGQVINMSGMEVSLDEVSCDRNIANLYFTLRKEGGFDLSQLASYEGSSEGQWAKLQNAIPHLRYCLSGDDGSQASGDVRSLDAYLQDDEIKCMMRITPPSIMAEQVRIELNAWEEDSTAPSTVFDIGLDMADLPEPKGLEAQDVIFHTEQGDMLLGLERFTTSKLGCVMVVNGARAEDADMRGIEPAFIQVTDDLGNILYAVDAGDGYGIDDDVSRIVEFAGISENAQSVTFTPILEDESAMEQDRLERMEAIRNGVDVEDDIVIVNVSEAGARIPLTDLGGFEIVDRNVEGSTVSISMKPYGWVLGDGVPELTAVGDATTLTQGWVDTKTGKSGVSEHSAIRFMKRDYATGETMQIDSYYKATTEELEGIHEYRTRVYPSGWYWQELQATQTFELS